ncbi:MAG: aminotransferase class III-fold pyridoxal phosphate-dependent enzyme [Candidatus Gastranaerophilales bacterium]|nr:aminotransferase class III-fold pyridoxal phosphate-dependent enzyme [Candidatus Gastranaerophilales bacterium]
MQQMVSALITDEKIREIDDEYSSFGDTVHYSKNPKIFSGCLGSYMYDTGNIPYLDLQMWYASCNLGYRNERIVNAVKNCLDTMPQIASRFLYDYKVLLTQKIAQANIKRFNEKGRVHFNVGGAQATEDAIKLIRNYTKKNALFAFMGGYHGRTIGASSVTSSFRYRENFGHFGDRAYFIPFPYCYRCHYDKKCEDCNFYCVKMFEKLFENEYKSVYNPNSKSCEYGAFIMEAIQGTGGYIIPPKGYFKELKRVLDKFNIKLIVDEIQMGMYRTGKLWSIEHFDVTPDVITFGKSLTNGMNPLSGLWAKEEYINPKIWPAGRTHSTYSSNPIGTCSGYEVMCIFEETKNLEEEIKRKGERFLSGLKYLMKNFKTIGNVDGLGLALRIECTKNDRITPDKELCDFIIEEGLKGNLFYKGKKCGIVLNNGGYYKNVITIVPAVTITDEEIDMAIELLAQLFKKAGEK